MEFKDYLEDDCNKAIYVFDLVFLEVWLALQGVYSPKDVDIDIPTPKVIDADTVIEFCELVLDNDIEVKLASIEPYESKILTKLNSAHFLTNYASTIREFLGKATTLEELIHSKISIVNSVALLNKNTCADLEIIKDSILSFISVINTFGDTYLLNVYDGVSKLECIDGSEEFKLDDFDNKVFVYIYCMYEAYVNYFKLPHLYMLDTDCVITMANNHLKYLKTLL